MTYPQNASIQGYATAWLTNRIFRKLNNNFVSGNMNYGAGSPASGEIVNLNFNAAPANGSSLAVPDGINGSGTPTRNFVFTYAGSPGSGVIPLVAGGGTAAQAATAAQVALAAQLTNWTVTNPSAGLTKLVRNQRGFNLSAIQSAAFLVGTTNISLGDTPSGQGLVVPGRFGKNYCTLPA